MKHGREPTGEKTGQLQVYIKYSELASIANKLSAMRAHAVMSAAIDRTVENLRFLYDLVHKRQSLNYTVGNHALANNEFKLENENRAHNLDFTNPQQPACQIGLYLSSTSGYRQLQGLSHTRPTEICKNEAGS